MSRELTLVLVAQESAGSRVLRAAAETGHRLAAVLTSPEAEPTGSRSVTEAADVLHVPVWPAELVRDPGLAERLEAEGVDLLLNIHSLFIVHPNVLVAPTIGCFNLHPGPLPEYAGLNAPSWAIYNGESSHAVTLHWMQPGIDTGPIAYRIDFPIREDESALAVTAKCVREGFALVGRLLADAAEDPEAIPKLEQDLSRRRYFGREVPNGGRLSWEVPARQIVDFVRACDFHPFPSPWGVPLTRLGDRDVGVAKASLTGTVSSAPPGSVEQTEEGAIRVSAVDEWVIVERVTVDGVRLQPADVLRT